DFHWTAKAEQALQQLKQHLSDLPLLVAPRPQEELIMYLSATHGAISAQKDFKDIFRHILSRSLLTSPSSRSYLVPTWQDDSKSRALCWESITLHDRPRTSIKGQILADFLNEMPSNASQGVPVAVTQEEPWTLFTNGSSCVDGSGAGLILTNPEGVEFTYALRVSNKFTWCKKGILGRLKQLFLQVIRAVLTFVSTSWRHPWDPVLKATLRRTSVMANATPLVDEGVPAELTGTRIAGAGETGLSTRGGSMRKKCRSGSCTELHRSHWLRQLIELDVNSFHDTSGSFVVDSITLPAWITEGTKDTKKGKIRLLIMHQLIWGFVMTGVNEGSILGVTSSSNSFYPKKHQGLRKYQHCPSSLNESTVLSFDNAVLLWSSRKEIDKFKDQMKEIFEMSDLGLLAYYLGIEVTQSGGDISIKQSAYARKILKEAGMLESNETIIPMDPGTRLKDLQGTVCD
nr:ribonuclease H-like domain, reverse transcriptase, RNA-dependent DNA polymerase [Tanacetum cinerariifolium]